MRRSSARCRTSQPIAWPPLWWPVLLSPLQPGECVGLEWGDIDLERLEPLNVRRTRTSTADGRVVIGTAPKTPHSARTAELPAPHGDGAPASSRASTRRRGRSSRAGIPTGESSPAGAECCHTRRSALDSRGSASPPMCRDSRRTACDIRARHGWPGSTSRRRPSRRGSVMLASLLPWMSTSIVAAPSSGTRAARLDAELAASGQL